MEYRRVGVLAAIISVLGLVVQYVPSVVLNRWVDGGVEGAIPMVGTTGQTVATYTLVVESAGPLVTFLLAIGFGYYVGRQLDVAHEHRRFGEAVAVGSLVSVAIIWAVWMYGVQSAPMNAVSVLVSLAVLVRMVVAVSVVVTVGAFAGAALTHFRTNEKSPAEPTETDAEGSSSVAPGSTTDSSDAQSSSV